MDSTKATESEALELAQTSESEDQQATDEAAPMRAKQRRGFAVMDQEAHREIARAGGVAAHAVGLANQFTSEKAREAGKKGGAAIAADREHMRAIGRKGGLGKRGFRKVRTDAK